MFMVNDLLMRLMRTETPLCILQQQIAQQHQKRFHLWPPLLQQRTIEILKAASAKQAKKLEGILEQEDLIIESIRDKRRKEMAGNPHSNGNISCNSHIYNRIHPSRGRPSEGPHQGMAVLTGKQHSKLLLSLIQ
ncbi:hypothetical protein CK203_029922 [Vitis vinifera]|uniref:Uncharacterized protein n=1 Tax=Vitis vinifera TaxID=29760 RepID=A0A438IDP8_VITVI|nr:hypothetical protein CK203_029922 [Vitis vinifera]